MRRTLLQQSPANGRIEVLSYHIKPPCTLQLRGLEVQGVQAARERVARARRQRQRQQDAAERVVPSAPQAARSSIHTHRRDASTACIFLIVPGTS
jgi:hypothetical protein